MNEVQFYNDLSDRLGVPRVATFSEWALLGRRIVGKARRIEFGYPVYGIESTAVAAAKTNPDEMTFEELVADLLSPSDAAMIARDGQAAKRARIKTLFHQIGENYRSSRIEQPQSTANPAPRGLTLSPDLRATSHLVEPVHGSVALVRELRNR